MPGCPRMLATIAKGTLKGPLAGTELTAKRPGAVIPGRGPAGIESTHRLLTLVVILGWRLGTVSTQYPSEPRARRLLSGGVLGVLAYSHGCRWRHVSRSTRRSDSARAALVEPRRDRPSGGVVMSARGPPERCRCEDDIASLKVCGSCYSVRFGCSCCWLSWATTWST
jgi:hypothetical protein